MPFCVRGGFCQLEISREAGTLGRGVPKISLAMVQNNVVILNLRYAIAYRDFSAPRFFSGGVDG